MRAGDGFGNGAERGENLALVGKATLEHGDLELLAFIEAMDDTTGQR